MNAEQTLDKWRGRAKKIQDCHYDSAAKLKTLHYATGLPLVILSAIAASSLVDEIKIFEHLVPYTELIASVIGVLVTILAAVQTFMGFEKRSELHYKAGVKYGEIKREIEHNQISRDDDKTRGIYLSDLAPKWDALTEESPIIPLKIWQFNAKKKEVIDNAP